jgi:PAS domain-containing protein
VGALHDGTRKLLHTVLTPLRQGGQIAGMLCVARDITPVRAAEPAMHGDSSQEEAALRRVLFQNAREEVYGAIIKHAEDGIVLIDTQTLCFAEFNDAACRELGYTREELPSSPSPTCKEC